MPYIVKVIHFKEGELGTYLRPLSVYLPHEVVATAFPSNRNLFYETFVGKGSEGLKEYWRRASHRDWFKTHPYRNLIKRYPEMAIPIRVHGDDASQNVHSSFLAISFAPVVVTGDPSGFTKRFLLGVLTLKDLAPDTMSAADSWCEPFVQSFGLITDSCFFSNYQLFLIACTLERRLEGTRMRNQAWSVHCSIEVELL